MCLPSSSRRPPLPCRSSSPRTGKGTGKREKPWFCSGNVDLGYFEHTVLSAAEATGARVTVIGDARASNPDPWPARAAGIRYVHGLAAPSAGGTFHSKVMVVAGRERALVAIGSGDLSPTGWGRNKETWTVATADRESRPELVADLADWLRSLDGLCSLAPLAAGGISRTAALLEELAVEADIVDTGHRLVHTSARPIIAQLPDGEVEHLLLYAPVHDERTAAVQALHRQAAPGAGDARGPVRWPDRHPADRPPPGHRRRGHTGSRYRGRRGAVPSRDGHRGARI